MGTRADFYVRSKTGTVTWKGSIAWDGNTIPSYVSGAGNSGAFCHALYKWFKHDHDDATTPKQGWPWPWETSELTDYSYIFDEKTNTVKTYKWGAPLSGGRTPRWPDMSKLQQVTWGSRSGLLVFAKGS
jgi:hypothetical protein